MLAQLFADMLQIDEEGEHKVGLKEFQSLLETYQCLVSLVSVLSE